MLEIGEYIACIVEGGAERTIIELLLRDGLLIFNRSQMLDEEPLRSRSATDFTRSYLSKSFKGKVTVIRVLDSRRTNFRIPKPYNEKVDHIYDVVTAPEIEMLVIIAEGRYEEYKRSRISKPSEFCKCKLGYSNVKKPEFISHYFEDTSLLLKAIREYARLSDIRGEEKTLKDLLC